MSASAGVMVPANLPAPVVNTPTPGAAPPPPAINLNDPDEQALQAAQAEVALEDGGQAPAQTQPVAQPNAPAAAPQARKGLSVPKVRFDEVAERARLAEQEVAYLRGAIEVHKAAPQQQPQQAPAAMQPAAPNQFQAIEQGILNEQAAVQAAAKQFDEGAITMTEFKAIEFPATQRIASLRERAVMIVMAQQNAPRPTTPGLADQDILNRHQADMEAAHPWVKLLTVAELQHLAGIATNEFAAKGTPLGSGPVETIKLRQRVAELSSKFGPDWYPGRAPAPNPPAQQTQNQPAAAPAQRGAAGLEKIGLANRHPPNTNQAGTTATGDTITESRLEQMTEREIEALPESVRRRFLTG